MTNKMIGARLPVEWQTDAASNGDLLMAAPPDTQSLLESDRQGWDPFEVWRTRVKEARDRRNPPVPVDTRKG